MPGNGPFLFDRIAEFTTTVGTGDIALAGAIPNNFTFASVLGDGLTAPYVVEDGFNNVVEWGIGTYHKTANTWSRTNPGGGNFGTSPANLLPGTKHIWIDLPAKYQAPLVANQGAGTVFAGPVSGADAAPAFVPISSLVSSVNAKAFGAIGDGSLHPITAQDIANHPNWVGTYAVGDQWDYVGLQETIYACFYSGTITPNGQANRAKNLPMVIPTGSYQINKALAASYLVGGRISGAGRGATKITQLTAETPVFQTNGCAYMRFEGIYFTGSSSTATAIFELDWDNSAGGVALQANTFQDIFFDGSAGSQYGSRIAKSGNMGSENIFLDCHWNNLSSYGLYITGFNALQNTVVGGNFQACLVNGVRVSTGAVNLFSVGFQNGVYAQVQAGGYDIAILNSANDHSSVIGCRSESAQFLYSLNGQAVNVENCATNPAMTRWAANTTFPLNSLISGVIGGNGDGKAYLVTANSAPTGATEPTWNGGTVTSGGHTFVYYPITSLRLDNGRVSDCSFQFGQVLMGLSGPISIDNNVFSRLDAIVDTGRSIYTLINNAVCVGGGVNDAGNTVVLGARATTSTNTTGLTIIDAAGLCPDVLQVHGHNANPFLAQFFNDAFSASTPVCQYFAYNSGDYVMGNAASKTFAIFTDAQYGSPSIAVATGGAPVLGRRLGYSLIATYGSGVNAIVVVSDSGTNTIASALTIYHVTSGTPANGYGASIDFRLDTSSTSRRLAGEIDASWATATDGSRKGRITIGAHDAATSAGSPREGLRVETDGTQALLGAFGAAAVAKPAVTGSKGANAALTSLMAALAALGLVTDSTT